jgi:hypothetical protein
VCGCVRENTSPRCLPPPTAASLDASPPAMRRDVLILTLHLRRRPAPPPCCFGTTLTFAVHRGCVCCVELPCNSPFPAGPCRVPRRCVALGFRASRRPCRRRRDDPASAHARGSLKFPLRCCFRPVRVWQPKPAPAPAPATAAAAPAAPEAPPDEFVYNAAFTSLYKLNESTQSWELRANTVGCVIIGATCA